MPLLTGSAIVRPSPIPLLRHRDVPHPERALARGELVRIRHGVYASAALWKASTPWDRYLARVHAAALAHPDAVFCLESAAALLGMPVFGDPVVVHVLVADANASRLVAGVRAHRSSEDRTLLEIGGLAMTSAADTAVDTARLRHEAVAIATADAALRLDPGAGVDTLSALNEARASSRGRRIARWSLSRATARAETALESVSRAVVEWLGYPAPELQVVFRASSGEEDRVDFAWRSAGIAGEADGDLKYDGRYGDARSILRRQGLRDTRLRSHVRAILHWGWTEAVTVAPLRGILSGSGLNPIAPEQSAMLHSLQRALRTHPPHHVG